MIACVAAIAMSGAAHAAETSSDAIAEGAMSAQLEAVAAEARAAFSADLVQVAADRALDRAAFENAEDNGNTETLSRIASLR